MSCLVVVYSQHLPRGKFVRVYLDLSAQAPKNYSTAVYQGSADPRDRRPYVLSFAFQGLTHAEALAWAEFQDQLPWPQADSGWKAVLNRLMGGEEYKNWDGSAAEYASRYYPVGTWEWVQVLIATRSIQESRAAAA